MKCLLILIGCLLIVTPNFAAHEPNAAWSTYGIAINDTPGNTAQQNPRLISDGRDGYIFTWEDGRSGVYNIYAQKIDRAGKILWKKDGVAVGKFNGNQNFQQIISDRAGGVIVVWQDYRDGNSDIYAQHLDQSGNPLWEKEGAIVCSAPAGQFAPELVSDNDGGAIITWHDYRAGKGEDVYAQRINSDGIPQWKNDGIPICIEAGTQWYPKITGDNKNGAIVTWTDGRISASDNNIYAQRVNASGNLLWDKTGIAISSAPNNQERPVITSVDNGAVIAWTDARSGDVDIYLQKVDINGKQLWAKDGVPACKLMYSQEDPKLSHDGSGGVVVIWTDHRAEKSDIYAQRIYHNGTVAWQENGRPITKAMGKQKNPEIIKLSSEDWVIVWDDKRKGGVDLFAQKINSAGIALWKDNGKLIVASSQAQESPAIATDSNGNTVVVWEDGRSGTLDIFAQKISLDGNLLWKNNGVLVCSAKGSVVQQNIDMAFNSRGEIVLVFEDARSGFFNIYAQKVNRQGKLAWGMHGIAIAKVNGNQINPSVISDDKGGTIICWEDQRNKNYPSIRTQKINTKGKKVWESSISVSKIKSRQINPSMISDGKGGAIISWHDNRDILSLQDIYAQRISSKGSLLWGEKGRIVISANGNQIDTTMISDKAGGAIFAWTDYRRGDRNPDIYAQRINPKGGTLWQKDGVPICSAPDVQRRPKLVSDENGGALITWTDKGGGSYDIYAQRVDKQGKPVWLKDGIPINQSSRTQQNPKFGKSNILVWEDYRYGNWDIFTSSINSSGKPTWSKNGVPVAVIPHTQYAPQITRWGNGVIIIWEDYRSGKHYEIYIQEIDEDGTPTWGENGIRVNTQNGGRDPKILANFSDNSFYVFWEDYTGGGRAIYGQRYILN
jgi:hypothetical protein